MTADQRRPGPRDRKRFERIVLEYDERLRGLAFRLLDDRDLMDDVLQDVYVKAFVALDGFRRQASIGTWLYRITYTTCIDCLRRQRRLTVLPDEILAVWPDPGADPSDRVAERDRVAVALRTLSPEQRATILLVDRDGFDYRAAAEVLDVPMGTVASRISTARAALRRILDPSEEREEP